jgi:hypothetical protein
MKHNLVSATLVIVCAMLSLAATAQTRDAACSLNGAAGTYGFQDSGMVVGIGPRTATGIFTLDALGNLTGNATQSLNGDILAEWFTGTYTIKPDCTGTFGIKIYDAPPPLQPGNLILTVSAEFVWDDNMNQARFIFTSVTLPNGTALPTAINGEGRKLVTQNEQ